MTLEKLVEEVGFTRKSLAILNKREVIQKVPTDEDMDFLSRVSQIWKDTEWIKESLRQIRSRARREKLVRELELTKPERYILNRYLNAKGRLTLERVAGEVAHYYGLQENMAKGIVRRMRSRVYAAKCRRTRNDANRKTL
jgi:hypothetical protein